MVDLDYRIVPQEEAEADYKTIQHGMNEHAANLGLPGRETINLFCYDQGKLIGALVAQTIQSRINVKWLWVETAHRSRKIGLALMEKIEHLAKDQGCDTAFVDTMSFQAPGFYTKAGYQEVARIADFYPGHDRIFFRKELVA